MSDEIRQGSDPDFCPPVEEGVVFTFEDEKGDLVNLEFLGLLLHGEARYGFFFPVDDGSAAGDSGEVLIMEVVEIDEDGQPADFELVADEAILSDVYAHFMEATKDIYRFE